MDNAVRGYKAKELQREVEVESVEWYIASQRDNPVSRMHAAWKNYGFDATGATTRDKMP